MSDDAGKIGLRLFGARDYRTSLGGKCGKVI